MKHKHNKNRIKQRKFKDLSEDDKFKLSLLYKQVKIIIIYMISDFILAAGVIQRIKISCNKDAVGINPFLITRQGQIFSLIASVLIYDIDLQRYNELVKKEDELDFSINPEFMISKAAYITIIDKILDLVGTTNLYEASLIIDIFECSKEELESLLIQEFAFVLRFLGDYFIMKATLKNIDLIQLQYEDDRDKPSNPKVDSVIGGGLIFLHRGILLDVNNTEVDALFNESSDLEKELLLNPKVTIGLANRLGIISNAIVYKAFVEIYNRPETDPIIGR